MDINKRTRCIITGCALRRGNEGHYAWGDLHIQGGVFVFGANTMRRGGDGDPSFGGGAACWYDMSREPLRHDSKVLHLPHGFDYYERNGVFVLQASRSLLNMPARQYILTESGVPE